MSERVSRVVLTERCAPIIRQSQSPPACLKGAKRRHCAPCALFGGPSGVPRRSESVRRCERFLACPGVLQQFVFQIEFGCTMSACGEARPR
jgi:hypothetical protein